MRKTTLVIMAAGIGSRFGGGIKQLTSFGPGGEIIMDYAIYDAIRAGFDKIVFVIRRDLEADFKSIIGDRIAAHVEVSYAFQELGDLPKGFALPEGRTKPWGTGQAILCCRDVVKEPFAVINADDYYGRDAFAAIHDFLADEANGSRQEEHLFGMAGFVLKNTLSEHGGVTRGVCRLDETGRLLGVEETRNIVKTPQGAGVCAGDGSIRDLNPDSLVSMNFWGFFPEFLEELARGFPVFLKDLPQETSLKEEYLLPQIVDQLVREGRAQVCILPSSDHWFGVTYKEDVPIVIEAIRNLIAEGVYPEHLWA